jgi:hypothetical protein
MTERRKNIGTPSAGVKCPQQTHRQLTIKDLGTFLTIDAVNTDSITLALF